MGLKPNYVAYVIRFSSHFLRNRLFQFVNKLVLSLPFVLLLLLLLLFIATSSVVTFAECWSRCGRLVKDVDYMLKENRFLYQKTVP